MSFTDMTGELRSDEELKDALQAINKELISASMNPIMLHYPTILDALKELLERRKNDR